MSERLSYCLVYCGGASLHGDGFRKTQSRPRPFLRLHRQGGAVHRSGVLDPSVRTRKGIAIDKDAEALIHARALAPDIVVDDHSVGSDWICYRAEEDNVALSSAVMERFGIRRRERFFAEQRFGTFDELLAKVAPQGVTAIERAHHFAEATNIVIPMACELNLL
jgi:hypothetical protein